MIGLALTLWLRPSGPAAPPSPPAAIQLDFSKPTNAAYAVIIGL
jgi:hypothetical protein